MKASSAVAVAFRMNDDAWCRQANPRSVYTLLAAISALIPAVWNRDRDWTGWWVRRISIATVVQCVWT